VPASETRTVPASSFESPAFIPSSARLTPLAMVALEAGVEPSNVRAYLSSRYAVRPLSFEAVSL
jgi:hypothetical protein